MPTLRSLLTVSFSVVAGLTLSLATALVLIASLLHQIVEDTSESLESVRLAYDIEARLFDHQRTEGAARRLAAGEELQRLFRLTDQHISSTEERDLTSQVEQRLQTYLAQPDGSPVLFEDALAGVRSVVAMNVEQSRTRRWAAMRWDRRAAVLGTALAGITVLSVVGVLVWLRSTTYRPALELSAAIDRFATGHPEVRAPERGPAELQGIARHFNRLADTLASQSSSRLVFLAGVAHDLRNPLGALKLATETFLPDRPLPAEEDVRRTLARVRRQVVRLERMVWDFLDASRIESGILDLRVELCDLRHLADAVVELFGPAASGHELVLRSADHPVLVRCDPVRVEQVITNLVSNAIKYSPAGTVVALAVHQESGWARVSVSDQGRGIALEEREQLFQPFRRLGASGESVPGVGLGLFVSRKIVEAHGGSIQIDSMPRCGATFHVTMPAAEASGQRN